MIPIHDYASNLLVNPDRGAPLRFEGYEFLRQPLEDRSPRVVIQKAAQVGATMLATIRALWFVDVRRAHAMYLFPTHRGAHRFSRGRFKVLLERSPYFRGKFRNVRASNHLRAGVANFYCHGARSRTELMSTPVQYLTIDERDEMYLGRPDGPQPWSAVDLARQRLSGQPQAWELNVSTPTIPDHGIAAEFAASDQHHFHPRCPHCGQHARLTWPDAILVQGSAMLREPVPVTLDTAAASCTFCCPRCRRPWSEEDRRTAIREGRWVAEQPARLLRGYHFSQLLSPAQSAAGLLRQWHDAQGKPASLQVFHNAVLGLPYVAQGARLDPQWLEEAQERGSYRMAAASQGSVMGVDIGPSWFHAVIAEPVGEMLRLVWVGLVRDWRQLGELVQRFRVKAYVLDAMPETHPARDFLRTHAGGCLCWYTRAGRAVAVDADNRTIHAPRTDTLDAMFLRWRLGKVLAPRDLPPDFVAQLTAPVRVVRTNRIGEPIAEYIAAAPDHYAHAMNYCELALGLWAKPVRFEIVAPPRGRVAWQG
jgi:hypothetical protein